MKYNIPVNILTFYVLRKQYAHKIIDGVFHITKKESLYHHILSKTNAAPRPYDQAIVVVFKDSYTPFSQSTIYKASYPLYKYAQQVFYTHIATITSLGHTDKEAIRHFFVHYDIDDRLFDIDTAQKLWTRHKVHKPTGSQPHLNKWNSFEIKKLKSDVDSIYKNCNHIFFKSTDYKNLDYLKITTLRSTAIYLLSKKYNIRQKEIAAFFCILPSHVSWCIGQVQRLMKKYSSYRNAIQSICTNT